MKTRCMTSLLAGTLLLGSALPSRAQTWETEAFWRLGSDTLAVPSPDGTQGLNCLLPENNGGYIAVWDTSDSAVVERRSPAGTQLWAWTPPTPLPETNELTRVVLSSPTRTLWCSSLRWFFLSNTNGVPVRTGVWSLPYLDPSRIIPQNENLYVLYGTNASIYNTNMEFLGSIGASLPAGYWHSHAGAWLVDLNARTNNSIRLATLGADVQVTRTMEIPFPTSAAGSYSDHRVLAADTNSIFVASTIHWPLLAQTRHYFTLFARDGSLGFQHYLDADMIITGSVVLDDGWVLSARTIGETNPRHLLLRVDQHGRPYWPVVIATGAPQQFQALNTQPPRILQFNSTSLGIRSLVGGSFFEAFGSILWSTISWSDAPSTAPAASTNYFWINPIRLNNT